jgi:hypothetical protein
MSSSIEILEGVVWPEPEVTTSLVLTGHALRKKPIDQLSPNELRVALNEDIGTRFLKRRVVEVLSTEPEIEATYFPGDLLVSALESKTCREDPEMRAELDRLAHVAIGRIEDPDIRSRIQEMKTANQALQTTSVTRSGFGKVPVSDRQRRGV